MNTQPIKERPIIMTAESVLAILDGRKTQTRRVIEPQPVVEKIEGGWRIDGQCYFMGYAADHIAKRVPNPRGNPGDRLWVKEAFFCNSFDYPKPTEHARENLYYRADGEPEMEGETVGKEGGGWKSPLFMPRWASRITLEISEVRVQRLHEINHEDACAEGILPINGIPNTEEIAYLRLWDQINAKRGFPWESNPWVWVYSWPPFARTPAA